MCEATPLMTIIHMAIHAARIGTSLEANVSNLFRVAPKTSGETRHAAERVQTMCKGSPLLTLMSSACKRSERSWRRLTHKAKDMNRQLSTIVPNLSKARPSCGRRPKPRSHVKVIESTQESSNNPISPTREHSRIEAPKQSAHKTTKPTWASSHRMKPLNKSSDKQGPFPDTL